MKLIRTLVLFIATAAVAVAAEPQKAVDLDTIKDKVNIKLGQEFHVKFNAEGDQLRQPKRFKGTDGGNASITISLQVTDCTPVPVKGVATRPYLTVSNRFERTLHYRALARLKGSPEFFEISEGLTPVDPGEAANKCWESGSLVEEVVLYQFSLSDKPSS